jgi:cobalt-precorrin 5A hydrolase
LSLSCVSSVCSIDRKAEEAGLLSFCEKWGITPTFYTAEALSKAEGDFTVSDFVRQTVGIDNVCERSAVLGGNRLLGKKFARDGVTVAIAEQPWILEITV